MIVADTDDAEIGNLDETTQKYILRDLYWCIKSFSDPGQAQQAMSIYGRWLNSCYDSMSDLWPYSTDNYPRQSLRKTILRRGPQGAECNNADEWAQI